MKILTVSELTQAIKSVLEPNFRGITVKGEISNFKLQSSGHLYFSLKDAGSQISAVLFRGNAAQLSRMPKDGDQVLAVGEISLYAPRGQYQIIIRELQFLGVGELLLKFQQMKEALKAKGYFETDRKKPLPKFPKRIGVVTSPTGAVIRDILHVLKRRFSGVQVLLNPVKVQGEGAAQEIAKAIFDFNRFGNCDVLIVGRGGGSIEDLWAFNEEIVAKAIFDSKIPIISAVGHETDFTIADWVADVRAPTPSAAAEIAVREKANLFKYLFDVRDQLTARTTVRIRQEKQGLMNLKRHPLFSSPFNLLAGAYQLLDSSKSNLEVLQPSKQIAQWKERFTPFPQRFEMAVIPSITEKKERLKRLWEHLKSLDPQNLLKKGYSILFSDTTVIHSAKNLQPGQSFTALLHDGKIRATSL